jgi:cytosine/creatinine deaminase
MPDLISGVLRRSVQGPHCARTDRLRQTVAPARRCAQVGPVTNQPSTADLLAVAVAEARAGLAEGGIPIGAALFDRTGTLLGRGHNRRVQDDDPSIHAETAAFRAAGRRASYADTIMVTTLSPCWYCSGLIRQFGIGAVVIGENRTFTGGQDWLADHGVLVTTVDDADCVALMTDFVAARPDLWFEDIGQPPAR